MHGGCREPPLEWRPNHLRGHLAEDRVIEVWLTQCTNVALLGLFYWGSNVSKTEQILMFWHIGRELSRLH